MDPVTLAAAKRYAVPGNGLKNAHIPALLQQEALNKTFSPPGDGEWHRQRFAFTIPPDAPNITFGLARNSGGGIHVDDVNIWKV